MTTYLGIATHKDDGSADVVAVPVTRTERLLIAVKLVLGRNVRVDRP